jgi:general secretion pathway protein K
LPSSSCIRGERGAALLIVLWMLLLMSLLAAAFVATTRSDLAIARNDVESARARALADAGVSRAVLALAEPNPTLRWRVDGTSYRWAFGGGTVAISIFSEGGKIDLNAAPYEVLESLFRHVGAGAAAAGLAQAVLDRRQAQPMSQPADNDGATIDPGQPAFASIEDLGALPNMTAPLLHAVQPLVTVYAHVPSVDPNAASREVLLALPGADVGEIDAFLGARAQQAQGGTVPAPPPASIARYLAPAAASAVTIRVTATTDTGAVFVREALVQMRDAQGTPYVVKSWTQSVPSQ